MHNAQVRIGATPITGPDSASDLELNELVWTQPDDPATDGGVFAVYLSPPVPGRWITLQNSNPSRDETSPSYMLTVAEVRA